MSIIDLRYYYVIKRDCATDAVDKVEFCGPKVVKCRIFCFNKIITDERWVEHVDLEDEIIIQRTS